MSLDYFYTPSEKIVNNTVVIDGDEFAHMTHVMRKREGEFIMVVDGKGTAYEVQLVSIKHREANGIIKDMFRHHHEPQLNVTIAVGQLKNPSRFDFLVEKVTEIGVKKIIPLHTARTIPDHAKLERWKKLALSAMKQSCRSLLPEVHDVMTVDEIISTTSGYDMKFLFHESAETLYSQADQAGTNYQNVLLLIGPEGGFTEEEVNKCKDAGFFIYSLGERRLRTETAAIVASTLLLVT